jgi:hypothetical protein
MLTWIIQTTIFSFILIFLIHYLIIYFTNTLTIPKIKYLENDVHKKYESIYNIIAEKNNSDKDNSDKDKKEILEKKICDVNNNDSTTDIHSLPININNIDEMKNELKSFLKNQLNTQNTPIEDEITFYPI